jgi:hypothetical protein
VVESRTEYVAESKIHTEREPAGEALNDTCHTDVPIVSV